MTRARAPFSVLFPDSATSVPERTEGWPEHVTDLNLDQVFDALTSSRREHDLSPFLVSPLPDASSVSYRQSVFRDLESGLRRPLEEFAVAMRTMRSHLAAASQRRHPPERASWFLQASLIYARAITALGEELARARPTSEGLRRCSAHLDAYAESAGFMHLRDDAERLHAALRDLRYCVRVHGARVTVSEYRGEPDYSAEVLGSFEKFRKGDVPSRLIEFRHPFQNQVQERIVDRLALLHPNLFRSLLAHRETHADLVDPTVARFDREIQLYLGYLHLIAPLKKAGLSFCYPEVSAHSREVHVRESFDLALALRLDAEGGTVVVNDIDLRDPERIAVVSGPNQGGKTTFARAFGQLHDLAALGFPVPGASARLFLSERVLTHFARQERVEDLHSGLEEELVRLRGMLERATPRSVVVMNETFASTASDDQLLLGREILGKLIDMDVPAVYVTFIDELSRLGPRVVSMMSTVQADDPARRTFKVVRKPADGRAHALVIADAHGLTYASIRERLRS